MSTHVKIDTPPSEMLTHTDQQDYQLHQARCTLDVLGTLALEAATQGMRARNAGVDTVATVELPAESLAGMLYMLRDQVQLHGQLTVARYQELHNKGAMAH